MSPEEELHRAEEAKQLLEHPMFKGAVEDYSQALLNGIRTAAIVDDKMREKLLLRYCILHDVVRELGAIMEGGKVAAEQMKFEEQQRTLKERFRSFLGS